jgi:CRISPR-associated endonuclease/helicase Cas3
LATDPTDLDLMVFWAKTSQDPRLENHWHPLLCHLLDVGAVASCIWETALSDWARKRLARNLGLSEDAAGRWLTFWTAMHDIGKCSRVFQLQGGSPQLLRANARLDASGFKPPQTKLTGPHGTITARELIESLTASFGFPPEIAWRLAVAIGGHHGVIPAAIQIDALTNESVGMGRWKAARTGLLDVLATLFEVPRDAVPARITNADALWIAGFASVADWVGSNQDFFPPAASDPDTTPSVEAGGYLDDVARPAAHEALYRLGWHARPTGDHPTTFEQAFGFAPNAMQTDVSAVLASTDTPTLAIIEAPMGLGKTESALSLANRWSTQLGATGLYFALPTRATSNQMLHRIRLYLEKQYPHSAVNLQLLQGASALSAEFQELKKNQYRQFRPQAVNQDSSDRAGWDGPPSVLAASWFTHRKRGLLAPFGVGTVDQALLAALQTRHVFVRLFGLGGKIVVVDEVHAYDTYMSTLLEQLLRWLSALGTSVILLSATLPNDRRAALLAAYADVHDDDAGPVPSAEPSLPTYPRLSWVSAGGSPQVHSLATPPGTERELGIDWVPDLLTVDDTGILALGQRLQRLLATGGCAAVICNTVRRSQQVYEALRPLFPGTAGDGYPCLDLFHARYPFEDRDRREKRALLRFGKAGTTVEWDDDSTRTVQRPDCAVLVATQVIEQSLDLDFDIMVSDPAPVDLLLQRSGRLQRHCQIRPTGIGGPRLLVGRPTIDDDGIPQFDDGTAAVYDGHILLRSWLTLQGLDRIHVPGDVSALIEAVYADSSPPDDLSEALCRTFVATREVGVKAHSLEAFEAMIRYIEPPSFTGELGHITQVVRDDDAPDIHPALQALTRLSPPSANIVCLYGTLDAPYVDLQMTRAIDIRGEIDGRDAAVLLRRSLSVSHRGVVHALLNVDPPRSWQQQALVRYHRPVLFDSAGNAPVPGTRYILHLDPDLGLTVTNSDS